MTRAFRCTRCSYVLGYASSGMLLRPKLCEGENGLLCLDWERITDRKALHCPECGASRRWQPLKLMLDDRTSVRVQS